MHKALRRGLGKKRAQGLVEYGLILVLIAVAAALLITFTGDRILNMFSYIASNIVALAP